MPDIDIHFLNINYLVCIFMFYDIYYSNLYLILIVLCLLIVYIR